MHNLMSHNQLEGWRESIKDAVDKQDDYFDCLIECTTEGRHTRECRRVCREMLM